MPRVISPSGRRFSDEKVGESRLVALCMEGGHGGPFWPRSGHFLDTRFCRGSSMVEQLLRKQQVVGSSPILGLFSRRGARS